MEHREWTEPGPVGKKKGKGEEGGKRQRRKGGKGRRRQESGDAG